ncbi:MAG: AAA family ATPase [Lachnospiraceae bacterium]|nr:AAA family ATPase [Lachnospiraceae bacterium]
MQDGFDQSFGPLMGPRSNYTVEEIEMAQKLRKKNGGSLFENLTAVTGREYKPSMGDVISNSMALNEQLDAFSQELRKYEQENNAKVSTTPMMGTNQASKQSMGQTTSANGQSVSQNAAQTMTMGGNTQEKLSDEDALDAFNGLKDEVCKVVIGQDDFVKKLVVAFKRPFVMKPEDSMARNAIFITGPTYTGKHLALNTLVKAMHARRIVKTDYVHMMDLSLYPNASEEKLFLQDLYGALQSPSEIIVFENYEKCHTSLLARLSDLVIKGKCNLSERYTMSNGQLVNVSNALSSQTVGSLSAKGKYLVFVSTRNLTKLSDAMGAPFINALGDVCEACKLSDEALKTIAMRERDELIEDAKSNALFELTVSEDFLDYSVKMAENNAGLSGIISFYKDLLKALSELRLNGEYSKNAPVSLYIKDESVMCDVEGESVSLLSVLPGQYTGEIDAVKKEMEGIVGLKEIKEYILSLEEYFEVQKRRRDAGLKAGEVNKHMIFTGNPGTGKTTIARIISRYLKAIGVLTGGQLVEVSRADLVGRYVGHTAPLTNQVISSAIGGVLFIDEAYSLYRGKDDAFGMEAIDTLVKGIEDNRDNLIVILAGYSKEMDEFLTANSGLKSRFPNIINFPDYTGEELLAIADITANSKGYTIDDGVRPALLSYFNAVQATRAKDAGNGRLVRNKIEDAILNQSRRLVADKTADMSALTSLDFELNDIEG